MTEEFKISQNTEEEEILVNLKLDDEEESASEETLSVNGKHKSRKKKKSSWLYTVIIFLLLGVMGYSGYQIASTVIRNQKAESVYEDIMNQYIIANGDPVPTVPEQPVQTEPSSGEPSGETETADVTQQTDLPEETEETAELITLEPDPETVPPTTAPRPTSAPVDPMRILNVDFTSLKRVNSDVVAWIQGLGGVVNYPVVQGSDNAYYLKHLFDGTQNANGTIFVHSENRFLQDDVTFIFGHHMRSGKMFGRLTDYESTAFYQNNPIIRLYTPNQVYTLKIFAVVRGTGAEQIKLNYADAADFNRSMQGYAARSMQKASVSVSYGDKLVCLCTCSRHIDDGRFFIYCKVMELGN